MFLSQDHSAKESAHNPPVISSQDLAYTASERRENTIQRFKDFLPGNQGQNLGSTVLYVPYSLAGRERERLGTQPRVKSRRSSYTGLYPILNGVVSPKSGEQPPASWSGGREAQSVVALFVISIALFRISKVNSRKKSINLSFPFTNVRNKLPDLCGN